MGNVFLDIISWLLAGPEWLFPIVFDWILLPLIEWIPKFPKFINHGFYNIIFVAPFVFLFYIFARIIYRILSNYGSKLNKTVQEDVAVHVPVTIRKKFKTRTHINEQLEKIHYISVLYDNRSYDIDVPKYTWDLLEKGTNIKLSIVRKNEELKSFILLNKDEWKQLKNVKRIEREEKKEKDQVTPTKDM